MSTLSLCLLLVTSLQAGLSLPLTSTSEVRVTLLKEHSSLRERRSSSESNLPDQLDFELPHQGQNVQLRLRRSSLVPVVTSDGRTAPHVDDAGVYTDGATGAAIIVKRESGEYTLSGIINKGDLTFELKPLERQRRDAGEQKAANHRMFPLGADGDRIDFGTDRFEDPEPREEIINILGQNHHADNNRNKRSALNEQIDQYVAELSRKRRAAVQHTIEYAMVADFSDYSAWLSQVGASTVISEMTLWYTYVAEAIRIRYESIVDPDIAMTTTVTILRILTNDADDDFLEDVTNSQGVFDGLTGLLALAGWVEAQPTTLLPVSDHYMQFTQFTPNGAAGVALSSRVCTFQGVSISKNNFQANLAGIAAHELGHSLSAEHDNDTTTCTDLNEFIMSTILSIPTDADNTGNPFQFSPCSIQAFKDYLAGVTCTLPENTNQVDFLPAPAAGAEAGQVLTRDAQCRLKFRDDTSFFCEGLQRNRDGGIESLCRGMFCDIPTDTIGFCEAILPQEFTPCNAGKWCVAGECVDIVTTTSTTTTTTPTTTTTTTTPTTTTTTTTPTTTTTTTTPTTTSTTTTTTTTPTTTTTTPTTTTTTPTTTTTTTPSTTTTTPTTTTTTPTTTTTTTPTTTTTTPTTTTTTTTPTTTTTTPTTTTSTTTTTTPTTTTSTTTTTPTTTTSTQRTTTPTTTIPSTAPQQETTTTTTTTTTTADPRPSSFRECIIYWRRGDYYGFVHCLRSYYERLRDERLRRYEEERRRQEEEEQRRREEKKEQEKKKKEQEQNRGQQPKRRYPQWP